MKFIQTAFGIAFATFISSCSCGLYHEEWKNESNTKRVTESMVSSAMKDQGFRDTSAASGDLHFKKRNSSIKFSTKDQTLQFDSSFCPFPWEIIMDRGSFGEMESLQGHLIGELKQQGIRIRKLQSSE
jgi:hypothetical protein